MQVELVFQSEIHTFYLKGQITNILSFVDHEVSVPTLDSYCRETSQCCSKWAHVCSNKTSWDAEMWIYVISHGTNSFDLFSTTEKYKNNARLMGHMKTCGGPGGRSLLLDFELWDVLRVRLGNDWIPTGQRGHGQ